MCVDTCVCVCVCVCAALTLGGVSVTVSESDQRCLSVEELGTHSQNVCMEQTNNVVVVVDDVSSSLGNGYISDIKLLHTVEI